MAGFGRRKTQQPEEDAPVAPSPSRPAPPVQQAMAVIVPRSAMESDEPYAPVQAVVDFINFQTETGLFKNDELPARAMQAYHCDYYLAQVNNGGHSQFIHNSQGAAEAVFRDVPAGLSAMGASGHAAIFADMLDAVRMDRTDELERLDSVFYALEKHNPLTPMNAVWIKGWPELQVIEDDSLTTTLEAAAALNPRRADRSIALGILSVENKLTDDLWLGFGLACMAKDGVEIILQQGNGSYVEFDGEQTIEWVLHTTAGRRTGIIGAEAVHLFERIEHSPPPRMEDLMEKDSDEVWKQIENFQPPERGAEIARIGLPSIVHVRNVADQTRAGAAIDLLLRMVGHSDTRQAPLGVIPPPERTAPDGPRLMVIIGTTKPGPTRALLFDEGAALMTLEDDTLLARVSREEIDTHWARRDL